MAPARLLLLALAQQATTFQRIPPIKAAPHRDVSVEFLPAGVVGLALGVSAALGARRTKKVLKRRKLKQEKQQAEDVRKAVAEARAEVKREADVRVEEARREAKAEAIVMQRAEIVQAQAEAQVQRRRQVEAVQASYATELGQVRQDLATVTTERDSNAIKVSEATELNTQLELDVQSLASSLESEITTLGAKVAELQVERDSFEEKSEKFERASEALQDEIFNLDVEFEQSSQAMNDQFQSDLERKLDTVKAAEQERGAVAKRLAVDNTKRELTAEYEADVARRSSEFETARSALQADFTELAEASTEARTQLKFERSRADSLTSKLTSATKRAESSEQRSVRLEQLALAAERRITAQQDLAKQARALAAEERDQWRGPSSGNSAERARELAAFADLAEKASAALPDVQAWRGEADVVETSTGEWVEEQFRRLDTDGDGVITKDELAAGTGADGAWVEETFQRLDADGSGAIDRAEFSAGLRDELDAASVTDAPRRIADGGVDVVARGEAAAARLEKRLGEAAALPVRLAAEKDAPVETGARSGGEAVAPAPSDELADLFA